MKRIVLDVSDDMYWKIDEIMVRDGFATRAEFLRFLIVNYFNKKGVGVATGGENSSDEDSQKKEEPKLYYGHPEEDFEFGIPQDVIDKIFEEVALKQSEDKNKPQPQS